MLCSRTVTPLACHALCDPARADALPKEEKKALKAFIFKALRAVFVAIIDYLKYLFKSP